MSQILQRILESPWPFAGFVLMVMGLVIGYSLRLRHDRRRASEKAKQESAET